MQRSEDADGLVDAAGFAERVEERVESGQVLLAPVAVHRKEEPHGAVRLPRRGLAFHENSEGAAGGRDAELEPQREKARDSAVVADTGGEVERVVEAGGGGPVARVVQQEGREEEHGPGAVVPKAFEHTVNEFGRGAFVGRDEVRGQSLVEIAGVVPGVREHRSGERRARVRRRRRDGAAVLAEKDEGPGGPHRPGGRQLRTCPAHKMKVREAPLSNLR